MGMFKLELFGPQKARLAGNGESVPLKFKERAREKNKVNWKSHAGAETNEAGF